MKDKYSRSVPPESSAGFSLLELMIVIVVIGSLTGIAVPIYKKNIENAKRSEAVAAIGVIRKEIQIIYGREGSYPISESFVRVSTQDWNEIPQAALDGIYFSNKDYRYRSYDGIEYRIKCRRSGVLDKNIWIDETGKWRFDVEDDE